MLNQVRKQPVLRARQSPALAVSYAMAATEVLEAQRLRYKVFAGEMGARLGN